MIPPMTFPHILSRTILSPAGVMASIWDFESQDQGSIPGRGVTIILAPKVLRKYAILKSDKVQLLLATPGDGICRYILFFWFCF